MKEKSKTFNFEANWRKVSEDKRDLGFFVFSLTGRKANKNPIYYNLAKYPS